METSLLCVRCVLPSGFPDISFDSDGICNYCHRWEAKWKAADFDVLEQKLRTLLSTYSHSRAKYNCLVPLSGGRDSTYVLYLAKERFGLRPLAVTFNNGFLSRYALDNILQAVSRLGVDHVLSSYDWQTLRQMYKAAVEGAGEFCSVCSIGIRHVILTYQRLHRIPVILHGASSRTDEQSPFEIICSHPTYVRRVLARAVPAPAIEDFVVADRNEWSLGRMLLAKLSGADYTTVNVPDYLPWNHEFITDTLARDLGWRTPDPRADHIDCEFSSIKYYLKERQVPGKVFKREKLSQLIRDGQISRDGALQALEQDDGPSQENITRFCQTLGLDCDAFSAAGSRCHLNFVSKGDLTHRRSGPYRLAEALWKATRRRG